MVKLISISLYFGLILSVLCIFINSRVNCHPLFLKTIARASSGSSGFNSLNSYNSGQTNQNSHNGISAINNNPLQGLINTKINIVGRALVQIGQAFERYGNTDNSGSLPKVGTNNIGNNDDSVRDRTGNNGNSLKNQITITTKTPGATFDIDTALDARVENDFTMIKSDIKPSRSKANRKKITTTTEASIDDEDTVSRVDADKEIIGDDDDKVNNGNNGDSLRDQISLTTKSPGATFDIDTEIDARINEDDDFRFINSKIKPSGEKTNGKKITTKTDQSIDDDDIMTRNDAEKDITGDDEDKAITDDADEKAIDDGDDKDGRDSIGEIGSKDDGDEKDVKDDSDGDKDEALKIDLFTLNGNSAGNSFNLDSDMKKVAPETSDGALEKDGMDINNQGSESSNDEQLENLDRNTDSNTNNGINIGNNGATPASGNVSSGSQGQGYTYNGNSAPNAQLPGYQYKPQGNTAPGYNYQGPNTQPGYNYQGPNTQPGYNYQGPNAKPGYNYQGPNTQPGYNYQQRSNIQQNGYKYQQPIAQTINNNAYNYVQAGSPSSGIKMNRIRSTTTGYHYPKPQGSISGSFIEGVLPQSIPYYNNAQSSLATNNNYRSSVPVLNNPIPNSQILNSALSNAAFNLQSSGMVTPSQIVNNLNLNNGYSYPTGGTYQSGVSTFNAAPNFNTNFGGNVNSNLGTSSIQSTFTNNYNGNTAAINSKPIGAVPLANIGSTINTNQRINQLSVQYSQNPNLNVNQFNIVPSTSGPTFFGNVNPRPSVLQSEQNSGFSSNPILGSSSSTLTTNRQTPNINSFVNPAGNQNSADPGRPFYAGNNAAGQNLVLSSGSFRPSFTNNNAVPGLFQSSSFAGNNNARQNLAQQQQSPSPNFGSVNQNQNLGKPLIDNIALIPSIVLNLNQQSSTTSSFTGNNNQRQNLVQNQNNQGQNLVQNQNNQRQNLVQNQNNQRQNLVQNQNNQGQNLVQNQNNQRQNLVQNQNNQRQNLVQNQNNQGQNLVQNQNNQRQNLLQNQNNQGQNLVQNQQSSNNNLRTDNQKEEKPEIDHFQIIPSLIRSKNKDKTNSNTAQAQTQSKSSFTTAPNFNFNLNSAFTGNNNNQRPLQQQSLGINTASNTLSNTNSATPGYYNSNNRNTQSNPNINRNLGNGFGLGQSLSDSTQQLTGTGYNTNNVAGISQGQNQGSSTQRTNNNNNNDDDVTKSSINTLSALKNLTESEYYENGAKKLQYPKDDDEDIAFRAASNSLLVGDIRRYRKQINPIQN